MESVGLLIVGYRGSTASTLLGTLELVRRGVLDFSSIPSSIPSKWPVDYINAVHVGGWDLASEEQFESLLARYGLIPQRLQDYLREAKFEPVHYDALLTALDIASQESGTEFLGSVEQAINLVAGNIEDFKKRTQVPRPVIICLSSPSLPSCPPLLQECDWESFTARSASSVPSSVIYAAAAVVAGADFVDFSPSEALSCPVLWAESARRGVQLAGSDGSTGQTMLKSALAQMFALRGLEVRSWFSSNHLGNRDGEILSRPEFAWLKLEHKKRGLKDILPNGDVVDHVVSIDYVPSKGDRKEAFDSVVAVDIFGSEVCLRLNWEGWDSALATPMLIDLIRLIHSGADRGSAGVQTQLSFFFKAPLLTLCESPEVAHSRMEDFYCNPLPATGDES